MDAGIIEKDRQDIVFDRWYLECPLTVGKLVIDQVKDSCFYGEHEIFTKKKDRFMLLFLSTGTGILTCGLETIELQERHYAITLCSDDWILKNSGGASPIRVVALRFHITSVDLVYSELFSLIGRSQNHHLSGADDGSLKDIMMSLLDELTARKRHTAAMTASYMHLLVIQLCRMHSPEEPKPSVKPSVAPSRKEMVYQTIRYLDQYLLEIHELSQIADKLGYSYPHLSRIFSQEMGESLQAYWGQKRSLQAMNLLQRGELNITQIAEKLHYQSVHSFSKAFKKLVGLTPSEYQELYGNAAISS